MTTPRRRTFSGAVGASLLGLVAVLGWVPAAAHQTSMAGPARIATDACPAGWPTLRSGSPADQHDGNVSVLVGGDLTVGATASGAEGVVVVRGSASFDRDEPGAYRVGVTDLGSQIAPHPGSDMLVVGGNLTAAGDTPVAVGPALDGDAVVGGAVLGETAVELGGGQLDQEVVDPLEAYDALLATLGPKSVAYADRQVTGTAEVTDTSITLTGDGVSDMQVFAIDGGDLVAVDGGPGRSLQVLGVPDGAGVVVNLVGPSVDLDIGSLLAPGGAVVDPSSDGYFGDLSTHLLWNVPHASTVDVRGSTQLPGSLLVASGSATTTLRGAGTNGRVMVVGDLAHVAGGLHSYPFLRDPELTCGPDLLHDGSLTLDVLLEDPAGIVDPDRFFEGTYACYLDGWDVTPGDGQWQLRAQAADRVLSDDVPVGALCFVSERLEVPPGAGWDWAPPRLEPARVRIAKRDPRGFAVTNSVQQIKTPPAPADPEPTPDPDDEPSPTTSTPTAPPTPDQPGDTDPTDPDSGPTAPTEETTVVPVEAIPSMLPAPDVSASDGDTASGDGTVAAGAPPRTDTDAGPLTTTAPYSLRGAFVWGPLLLLSVLALRLRFPWRHKRRRVPRV